MRDHDGVVLELALVAVLILLNGFFSAAEMAVVSARRSRLQARLEQGDRRAAAALRLKDDPDRFLATVQIGVTVVGTLASAVGGVAAIERLEPKVAALPFRWAAAVAEPVAVVAVVCAIAYLSLVVGELVPKGLAVRNAEAWAVRIASVVEALSHVSRWAVAVLTASSRLCLRLFGVKDDVEERHFHTLDDLRIIADEAQEQGVVGGGLVKGAVEFHERLVKEVLTPRHRVVRLSVRAAHREALKTVRESGHSRFPVYDHDPDDVIGFVYAREVYEAALRNVDLDLAAVTHEGLVVPESKRATELLAEMRRTGVPVSAVVDEHGTFAGIVTVEDLVEVIVGEIPDEHSAREPLVAVAGDGTLEADGSVPVHELNGDYGVGLPESGEYVSLAGLILHRLAALPRAGQRLDVDRLTVTILRMEGPRIKRVRIDRRPNPPTSHSR